MCACHFYGALDRYTTPLKIKFANYTTLSKKLDRSIYVKTSFISELTALSEKKLGVNIMSNSILFLLVIIESYTICMTSADIMSTRDSHLNQNKYVLPTTLCHYALQNGLKWFLKEYFCSSVFSSIWVSLCHRINKKFSTLFWLFLVMSTQSGRFYQIFVTFSEYLNFTTVIWMFHKSLLKRKMNKNASSE